MVAEARSGHPAWCDEKLCTVQAAAGLGFHRSAVVTVTGGFSTEWAFSLAMSQPAPSRAVDPTVEVTVTYPDHGWRAVTVELAVGLGPAAEIAAALLSLVGEARRA